MTWMLDTSTYTTVATHTRSTQLKVQHRPVNGYPGPALAEELLAEEDFWGRGIHFSLWGSLWYIAHAPVDDPTPMCI